MKTKIKGYNRSNTNIFILNKNQLLFRRLTNLAKPLTFLVLFVVWSNTNSVFAQNWDQIIKTVASDRGAGDDFGYSVDISGEYAIVGAWLEGHDTTGGAFLTNAGSAYIFKNNAGIWSQVQKIVASDRGADDHFGYSVAISGDYAIVSAYAEDHDATGGNTLSAAGSAYIFKNNAGTWSEVQKIVASDRGYADLFGCSVAISGDYAIVGAVYEDHDATGGNTLTDAGSAYIFKNNAGTWSEVQKIVASDRAAYDQFGFSVAISGDYAIVGANYEVHDTTGGNSLSRAGSAYIFKNNAGTWSEVQKIVASDREANDQFGYSVAISGDYAIVGAFWEDHDTTGGAFHNAAGSAYIFKNNAGTWSQVQKIVASDRAVDDWFGWSVAISGDYAIVGAFYEDEDTTGGNTLGAAGSAYIFKNNAGTWSEEQKIVASDREVDDLFGCSVAISGDYAIVGAYEEDEDASGGNTLTNAGSAYIFKKNCATSGTDVQTACNSFTWIDGNTYTASNNTATHTLTNAAGCDSVVTLDLTIYSVSDISTSVVGTTITANNANATYQWLDCNINYAVIQGETNQSYTPTINGSYAVELTENGCADTSACVNITTVKIIENSFGSQFTVYPNPTSGQLIIVFENEIYNLQLTLRNLIGQEIFQKNYSSGHQINLTLEGAAGVYFIEIVDGDKRELLKVIKE